MLVIGMYKYLLILLGQSLKAYPQLVLPVKHTEAAG
jgi:hypothetical protein